MLTSNSQGICSAEWQVSMKGIPTERPATGLGIGVAKHKTLYKVSP
ncbi:TPA: hypothetical protein ACT9A8_000235 [Legionella pneumophila]